MVLRRTPGSGWANKITSLLSIVAAGSLHRFKMVQKKYLSENIFKKLTEKDSVFVPKNIKEIYKIKDSIQSSISQSQQKNEIKFQNVDELMLHFKLNNLQQQQKIEHDLKCYESYYKYKIQRNIFGKNDQNN
ncbi:hypothetical protein PPERSA_03715 [Pseudocohnilembus persalinus]|uniref:Uncharacterized protein n=1 Tax=Pseudocohnilembus persalinus TaxID=266149 RepID=A0A0V0QHC1_PSEPJ|nr:hypothetical protein PPERSA_03715 [Pseudocohnilembus persalinus]|eukprot:KRX01631.1 hypothetical protein PPERSA_03715 [Pseudocohnilembus persalinus]